MYNAKQYDAAVSFLPGGGDVVNSVNDKRRIQSYDLYENIYINSVQNLRLVIRGEDQVPILMPSGRKIIEATNRFLGVGFDYFVEPTGDEGIRTAVDSYFKDWFKREALRQKFASNKRWGLVRGDAMFLVYARPEKDALKRICIKELDPRQVFEIEDTEGASGRDGYSDSCVGYHIVEMVHDFREDVGSAKQIARRRTFRKVNASGEFIGAEDVEDKIGVAVTSELTFWEPGKWDDRDADFDVKNRIRNASLDEEEFTLEAPVSELPIYHWRNNPPQNSSWGVSQLTGLETLLYALNQSLTDEDATIVFQGLGMYVTNSKAPLDADGNVTDWNVGPMQIIEIGTDQMFERVTGVSDVSPYQNHMTFIDEKGISESSGTPEIAIGRVDVAVAESGISLQLQLMPLLAQNAEKELEFITVIDQMFHDIATMWLPAYEDETFGASDAMAEISVVAIFDDPMPRNRDAVVQETLLLRTSNLILTSMAVAKLRELGWEYPQADDSGNALTDEDIAAMLTDQASSDAASADPFAASGGGTGFDPATGEPIDQGDSLDGTNGFELNGNTPDQSTIPLG